MNQTKLSRIPGILQEMVDTNFVSGVSCMVLQGGEEQCYFEAGLRDVEAGKPMTRDTICRMYSMSKPVTAAAVMALVEDGRLDLIDPLEKFLPAFHGQTVVRGNVWEPAVRPVTIRNLMNMTSGITYGGETCLSEIRMEQLLNEVKARLGTDREIGTVELANRISEIPLAFQPGDAWWYGMSADVLGAVVEVVSGMRFGEYLQKRIFEPLGMEDTAFYVPEEKQDRLARVYRTIYDEEGTHLKLYTEDNLGVSNTMTRVPAFESGGAGLASTIDDYRHFTQMLLQKGEYNNRQVLSPRTVAYLSGGRLTPGQQTTVGWESMAGYTYGNLMRVMVDLGQAPSLGSVGEYGWDGWLGTYLVNDPAHRMTFLMMHQKVDSGTTDYTRRLRNVAFAALEE